jgi:hypothetical protein
MHKIVAMTLHSRVSCLNFKRKFFLGYATPKLQQRHLPSKRECHAAPVIPAIIHLSPTTTTTNKHVQKQRKPTFHKSFTTTTTTAAARV